MDVDIQRRALSDVGRDELDTSRAEFYTAVGPDGKEVILRKYLKDQAAISETQDNDMRIGFVSQALGHLQQEYENEKIENKYSDPVLFYQQQREALLGNRSNRSSIEHREFNPHHHERYDHNQGRQRYEGPHFGQENEREYIIQKFTQDDYPVPRYEPYDSDEDFLGYKNGLHVEHKYSNGSTSRSPKHKIRQNFKIKLF